MCRTTVRVRRLSIGDALSDGQGFFIAAKFVQDVCNQNPADQGLGMCWPRSGCAACASATLWPMGRAPSLRPRLAKVSVCVGPRSGCAACASAGVEGLCNQNPGRNVSRSATSAAAARSESKSSHAGPSRSRCCRGLCHSSRCIFPQNMRARGLLVDLQRLYREEGQFSPPTGMALTDSGHYTSDSSKTSAQSVQYGLRGSRAEVVIAGIPLQYLQVFLH